MIEKTGLGKTSIDELDPSYRRMLALEQAEGSAEPADNFAEQMLRKQAGLRRG